MDPSKSEVAHEFLPFLRIYKDGSVERLLGTEIVDPSVDPLTGVSSKDVVILPETGVSARLYLPKITDPHRKLPLLVYFHGGGFCIETAFSPTYHHYLNSLVAEANVVAVSVDYRRAPEHPLPIAYEDSWKALEWVVSVSKGEESEEWLKEFADLERVFVAGDSAGANIAHNMCIRNGEKKLDGLNLTGMILVHPYFHGEESTGAGEGNEPVVKGLEKFWVMVCPATTGTDDPLINPATDRRLPELRCNRVLVCVAENDFLRDKGRFYYEILKKSGWRGEIEIMESQGVGHVFHLFDPVCEKAGDLMKRLVLFINQESLSHGED